MIRKGIKKKKLRFEKKITKMENELETKKS